MRVLKVITEWPDDFEILYHEMNELVSNFYSVLEMVVHCCGELWLAGVDDKPCINDL